MLRAPGKPPLASPPNAPNASAMFAQLRPMTPADFESALDLWRQTEGMGLNSADTPDQIRRFLERKPGMSTVAESDGKLVGTALCGHDGRRGFIYHLAVARNARGEGIGRRLVEQSVGNLKEAGLTRCHIVVYAHNTIGQEFWEHLSFTPRRELLICSSLIG